MNDHAKAMLWLMFWVALGAGWVAWTHDYTFPGKLFPSEFPSPEPRQIEAANNVVPFLRSLFGLAAIRAVWAFFGTMAGPMLEEFRSKPSWGSLRHTLTLAETMGVLVASLILLPATVGMFLTHLSLTIPEVWLAMGIAKVNGQAAYAQILFWMFAGGSIFFAFLVILLEIWTMRMHASRKSTSSPA